MRIGVMGTGHVGLVCAACFADLGHEVTGHDCDTQKISLLKKGIVPIFEPGLEDMVRRNQQAGRLTFTSTSAQAIRRSEVIFITVGTPPSPDGSADLSSVEAVSKEIARELTEYKVIVEKSTVPVRTAEWVKRTIALHNHTQAEFDVASCPEFLREGSAIHDFLHPDRTVIGVESPRAEAVLKELFRPLPGPKLFTDIKSAELIKHASNAFLALKVSYINAIARICELVGADVTKVAEGLGSDSRIGPQFLGAGVGYGGPCFPKDVAAFIRIAQESGYDFELLKAVEKINREQRSWVVRKLKDALWNLNGKTIAILGLAFKPNTDDMRDAPSLEIVSALQAQGAHLRAYDPAAMENARQLLPEIAFSASGYEAAQGAEAIVILTEWEEFRHLDLARLKGSMALPIIVDGRNLYDPAAMKAQGFDYRSMGR